MGAILDTEGGVEGDPGRQALRPLKHGALIASLLWVGCAASVPTVVAVGDVACDPVDADFADGEGTATRCRAKDTAALTTSLQADAVLLLGDLQYNRGTADAYAASFDRLWGSLKARLRPSPGNHEYGTADAAGYYDYFGVLAGPTRRGYYAFELGEWEVLSLNSNCEAAGGCGVGSAQYQWVQETLKAKPRRCTLAYWHHPRFSSSLHGDATDLQPLWELLQSAGVDLVLVGHDHTYERFAPMSATGTPDPRGIRQIVVGTGGMSLYGREVVHEGSEAFGASYGVLKLRLRPTDYDWEFVPTQPDGFRDSGRADCH